MITRVWSSLRAFHEVKFESGMNVVLADQDVDVDELESTNGLGKTTLLQIIQFCLGSGLTKKSVLSHPELNGTSFGLAFIYNDQEIEVVRNTGHSIVVDVSASFLEGTKIPSQANFDGRHQIQLEDWKSLLSLRLMQSGQLDKSTPSFRKISRYLIRISKPAFSEPTTSFQGQSASAKRACTSYLLRLNWSSQRNLQMLLDRRNQINTAITALADAETAAERKAIGDLEADRVALEATIREKRMEIESFNVRKDYQDLQNRLTDTDRTLHNFINENHSDKRLLRHYEKSADELPQIDPDKPVAVLRDAGAIFREDTLKKLDEVAAFHAEVHRNRAEFLMGEIQRLQKLIKRRNDDIIDLTDKKTEILQILQTCGALDTLVELQRSYTEQTARHEALKTQLVERRRLDLKKEELSAAMANERALMKRDLEDRRTMIDEARMLFAEFTKFLYGDQGGLVVNVKQSGYSFDFSINREGSDGVDQMVVFCFDLTVATLQARRSAQFRTLVHDSSLFADVDPRQYGLALQLAKRTADAEGFQYICCLNAGALPSEHLGELDLKDLTRLRLTDEGDAGRLLGTRLPPRKRAGQS